MILYAHKMLQNVTEGLQIQADSQLSINDLNSKTVSELILCRLPSRRSTCMVW